MFARIWKNGSSLVVLDPEYVGSEWLHCQAKSIRFAPNIKTLCNLWVTKNNNGSSEETSRNNRGNNELNLPNTASHYSNSSTIQEIDLNNKHIYENKGDENVDSFLNLPKQQHDNSSLQEVPL
ncbi:1590_t:CDS:2 [Entrophospora sp. SA101]|nr:1590_t:CDS:2 [Entrophospora sp. SA101]